MTESLAARDALLNFLRKEIVGPSPGYPAVQIDGEEILRAQDPPRQRYGAGILFPMRSEVVRQNDDAADEVTAHDAGSPHSDQIVEAAPEIPEDSETGIGDNAPDTDRDVTLANEHLPSAMGLSALLEVSNRVRVRVRTGVYRNQELEWDARTDRDRKATFPKAWWRESIDRSVEFKAEELLGAGTRAVERNVVGDDRAPSLSVHVVSRPHGDGGASRRLRLVTFTLINRRTSENRTPHNEDCFFQCGFSVQDADGHPCFLSYPDQAGDTRDSEDLSLQLLYLHRRTFAVGHGCAPEWSEGADKRATTIKTEVLPTCEVKPVLPTQLEGLDLRMSEMMVDDADMSIDLCNRLADKYENWITEREKEIETRRDLTSELKGTARRHMDNCHECLRRMREGVTLIAQDDDFALAFRLMNEAMFKQYVHYTISTEQSRKWKKVESRLELDGPFVRPDYGDSRWDRRWRPFQLAFILMNLKAIADPGCNERAIVDVIWFPTGGGKTEAYLGLSAFAMFLRRLRNPAHAGTCILMRYTLRLLTTQQFQRAASMVCACEVIRRREVNRLGSDRFSIGLWVGGEVTPNTEKDSVGALRDLQAGRGVNKFIMLSCPWCGASMGPQRVGHSARCKGYRKLARPDRVRHICEDVDCDFSSGDGLPLAVVDEHIYATPPTMVVGTVDKFAMLAFQPSARHLFGIDTPYPPPELIIQDELHLISGPLGSMVGHYETVVNALCTTQVGARAVPAKVIASTATISHAETQVRGLYGRSAFLFPPQALRAGDSFFAEEREDEVGRLYVGVFPTALPSHVTAQVRTMGALLQAPRLFDASKPSVIDPYWTLMGYFNSLRELGHAATLIRADIREFLNALWDRLGLRLDMGRQAAVDRRRFINRDVELTSRVQSSEISGILQQLFNQYEGPGIGDVVDVCFATNMIQVGLDVPRLSLMTIVGQPKTTSEYIQASSRVGRDIERPGLVVANYNPFKPRDRSHYEHFRSYHQAIYRYVEPTSVTAFSAPVRERALHALIVILCRYWGGAELRDRPNQPPSSALVQRIKASIRARVLSVDKSEWSGTDLMIDEIVRKWSVAPPPRYGSFGPPQEEMPLMYPAGGQQHPEWNDWPYATPSSMRNVDADCSARPLMNGYGKSASG